jgi:hypothetical protein
LFLALIAAQEHALRTRVAVALAASGATFGYAEAPFRATLRATFEFFDADRAATKLLFRDAYLQGKGFNKRLTDIYERLIHDIETLIAAAQTRREVVAVPPRPVAYTLTALIGQIAHRRLTTDDGITAAEAADFVVSFVIRDCVRTTPLGKSGNHNGRSARSVWRIDRGGMFVHHRRGKHLVR